jgi:SIR2-like protein
VFTLNQDLFIERWFRGDHVSVNLPGISLPDSFTLVLPLGGNECLDLPDERELEKRKSSLGGWLSYIKLHGSYGWRGVEGSALVIGNTKATVIQREPLLRWYISIFKKELEEGPKTLVVVGYSFRDDHINQIIVNAIKKYGLRLIVVSPLLPSAFKEQLQTVQSGPFNHYGSELWNGLAGYYCGSVNRFYDFNEKGRVEYTNAGISFFDSLKQQ